MATINEQLKILLAGRDLTFEQSRQLLDTIFEGQVSEAQIAAFLTAMHIKSPSVQELAGLAFSLREHAVKVNTGIDNLVDTCGTGGAEIKTFNISTAAAIVAAGAGVYIAKHGNRCITSKCGSADLLAELGVNIEAGPEIVADCIRQAHIGFMFAPKYHPAMKYVQPIRRALEFRTVFNFLGPLANPAAVTAQIIGVPEESLMPKIAEALRLLGLKRAFVVHSKGLDEISTMAATKVLELKDSRITAKEFHPRQFGFNLITLESIKGNDPKANALIVKNILTGKDKGPCHDIVVFNAAAAVVLGNIVDDFPSAIKIAEDSIDSGNAFACLEKLIEISKRC